MKYNHTLFEPKETWVKSKNQLLRLHKLAALTTARGVVNLLRNKIAADELPRLVTKSLRKVAVSVTTKGFENAAKQVSKNSKYPDMIFQFLGGGSLERRDTTGFDFHSELKFFKAIIERTDPRFTPEQLIHSFGEESLKEMMQNLYRLRRHQERRSLTHAGQLFASQPA